MRTTSWLQRRKDRPIRRPICRLRLEKLEDRCVPTVAYGETTLAYRSAPNWITAGPSTDPNHVWVAEPGYPYNAIGRANTAGVVDGQFTAFPVFNPPPGVVIPPGTVIPYPAPTIITAGPNGHIWFSNRFGAGPVIGEMDTSGQVVQYFNPASSDVARIVAGPSWGGPPPAPGDTPNASLWFSEYYNPHVGRLDPADGSFHYYPVPFGTNDIAFDSQGNLWCTPAYLASDVIVRLNKAGTFCQFPVPGAGILRGLAAGADGSMWTCSANLNQILNISSTGTVTSYSIPTPNSGPYSIVTATDGSGDLWFAEGTASKIGQITPDGVVTDFNTPTANSGVGSLVALPDGSVWFTEPAVDKIGRLTLKNHAPTATFVVRDSSGNVVTRIHQGQPIHLDASGSSDPDPFDGASLTYHWQIDGITQPPSLGGPQLDWIFSNSGLHTISLTVEDGWGTISAPYTQSFAVPPRISPSVGDIDEALGADGVATTDTSATGDAMFEPSQMADGRIVAAIRSPGGVMVGFRRFLANGLPDPTFGPNGDGRLILNPAPAFAGYALRGDQIIMAIRNGSAVSLTRLNADGSTDSAFGAPVVSTNISGPVQMIVRADGRIVVAVGTATGLALVRRNADGSPDTSFSATGEVDTDVPYQQPAVLAVQPDGKILVGDSSVPGWLGSAVFAVMRFNSNGTLDTGDGTSGNPGFGAADPNHPGRRTGIADQVSFFDDYSIYDPMTGLALDPAGRIVVSGTGGIVRYTNDGQPDTTFGPSHAGVAVLSNGLGDPVAFIDQVTILHATGPLTDFLAGAGITYGVGPSGLAVQSDGKIQLAGPGMTLIRLNIDGSPDLTFGPGLNGLVSAAVGNLGFATGGLFLQGGHVTLIGNGSNSIRLARFTTAPPPDHIVNGQVFTLGVRATDRGPADAAGFTFQFNWGVGPSDTVPQTAGNGSGVSLPHMFPRVATETKFTVQVTATDQGGLTSQPYSFVVTVDPLTTANLQGVLSPALPTDPTTGLPAATFQADSSADANAVIAVVNGLAAQSSPVAVVLNVGNVSLSDLSPQPPAGVTLVINGNGTTTTIVGQSPALTLSTGNVVVTGVTFTTATNAPTIVVTGGHLTLRNDAVQESTGYNQVAIQVTGGAVDLGTPFNPGGNTVSVNGAGTLLINTTTGVVPGVGDSFTINGTPVYPVTNTTVSSSLAASVLGQEVTFTATVTADHAGTGIPTGTVTFRDAVTGTTLGTVALLNGHASLTTATLAIGVRTVTGTYGGDASFLASSGFASVTVIPLSSLSGIVWEDFNNDGQVDFGERGIHGVAVALTGTDDLGNAVNLSQMTDADGAYIFLNLRPGSYRVTETQPAGYLQGIDPVGTAGGSVAGTDQFLVPLGPGVDGLNYNFGERPTATGSVKKGQTAGIGFWNNKNGQALINAFNGGAGTELADWLAVTLPNMFGIHAGGNNLTHKSNGYIAALFQQDFVLKGVKLDAQVLATALSVYATNATLDSTSVAARYGFTVSGDGVGSAAVNVGGSGAAFGVANNTIMTVMDLLLATDAQAVNGALFGGNTTKRNMANDVFSAVNQAGGI